MNKKESKRNERYPIELPSRNNGFEHSPIVDVTDNGIYPYELNSRRNAVYQPNENISEVVTTEIEPDLAGQTIHERQM